MKAELLIAFTNEIAIGEDGWAQIAPFGDFPGMALISDGHGGFKKEKVIQRMDLAAVTQMVNEYQRTRKGQTQFTMSRPIYLGHPDAPGAMGAKYSDKAPKGMFANVACRSDGFFGEPILTEEGEEMIATRKVRALSGRWDAEPTGEEENGIKIYRPMRFLSAGLTNEPNLPVQLLNEAEIETDSLPSITNTNPNRNMSNKHAGSQFLEMARNIQGTRGCSWDEAWDGARALNPKLYEEMKQPATIQNVAPARRTVPPERVEAMKRFHQVVWDRMSKRGEDYAKAYTACQTITHVQLYNEVISKPIDQPEPGLAAKAGILGLSWPCDEKEIALAWKANANSLPVDAIKVVQALTDYYKSKKGLSAEAAREAVLAEHTSLRTRYNLDPASKSKLS